MGSLGTNPQVDEGLRTYMLRIYYYMTTGLVLTGTVAFTVASKPEIFGVIFNSWVVWIVMLAPFALIFFLAANLKDMGPVDAQISYWLFAILMGLSLSTVFVIYTDESIARVFFMAAGTFAATSLYGYTTRSDLTTWYSFLVMGVIGLIIVMGVNFFVGSTQIQLAASGLGVLIFVGVTAFDTQKLKEMYLRADGAEVTDKKAIMGALQLYLDFINLFNMLLYLFGERE